MLAKEVASLSVSDYDVVLTSRGPFKSYSYRSERELEGLVRKHSKQVFGAYCVYFDVKQKLMTEVKTWVVDGLLIDLNDLLNPCFWLVEFELSRHDPYRIVEPQLRGFLRSLRDERTLSAVRNLIYDKLKSEQKIYQLLREAFGPDVDIFYQVDRMLRERCGLLVVLDEVNPQYAEVLGELSKDFTVRALRFKTFYHRGNRLYAFTTLLPPQAMEWRARLAWMSPGLYPSRCRGHSSSERP